MFTLSCASAWVPGTSCEKIKAAGKLGFKAIEILKPFDTSPAEIAETIQSTGVAISAINVDSADEKTREMLAWTHGLVWSDTVDYYKRAVEETLENARKIGTKIVVTTAGNERFDVPRQVQHDNTVKALQAVAGMFESAGVTLVLEPLNVIVNHKGHYLVLSKEGFEMVNEVGSKSVKLLYDVYHQQISEGNLIDTITANIGPIGHIHLGDVPGRAEPGTGEINYPNVFKAIDKTGYSGYAALECKRTVDAEIATKRVFEMLP